ncbi:MAG: hypothetical protein GF419_03270 [Ignavibacteriales bacterium]|nr:hypothetical protein [Ignavibacteriales bacterium]
MEAVARLTPLALAALTLAFASAAALAQEADGDGDGVPDYIDVCPDTPAEAEVDAFGCPKDSDHDGVPDFLDLCPETKLGVAVDANGCPMLDRRSREGLSETEDADGDGVPDFYDRCPGTPRGEPVDEYGCSQPEAELRRLDELTRDRVADSTETDEATSDEATSETAKDTIVVDPIDRPERTPEDIARENREPLDPNEFVPVYPTGDPAYEALKNEDGDSDGVPDFYDHCPNTMPNQAVDRYGCAILNEKALSLRDPNRDTDRDGVPDNVDDCPNTLYGVPVDERGCPAGADTTSVRAEAGGDEDSDFVPDGWDLCPGTEPGVAVDLYGCPAQEGAYAYQYREERVEEFNFRTDGNLWAFQLAEYDDVQTATRDAESLRRVGLQAFVVVDNPFKIRGTRYQVRVGFFQTADQAKDYVRRMHLLGVFENRDTR